jgi:hypothetical protein
MAGFCQIAEYGQDLLSTLTRLMGITVEESGQAAAGVAIILLNENVGEPPSPLRAGSAVLLTGIGSMNAALAVAISSQAFRWRETGIAKLHAPVVGAVPAIGGVRCASGIGTWTGRSITPNSSHAAVLA